MDGDDPEFECEYTEMTYLQDIVDLSISKINRGKSKVKYRELAKSVSQKLVHVVYWDLSWGGCLYGVNAGTPFEWLHTGQEGMMQYLCTHTYTYHNITEKKIDRDNSSVLEYQHCFNTSEFERRVRVMSHFSMRQSDRSFPTSKF